MNFDDFDFDGPDGDGWNDGLDGDSWNDGHNNDDLENHPNRNTTHHGQQSDKNIFEKIGDWFRNMFEEENFAVTKEDTKKFARKNKAMLIGAGIVLTVGIGAMVYSFYKQKQAKKLAEQETQHPAQHTPLAEHQPTTHAPEPFTKAPHAEPAHAPSSFAAREQQPRTSHADAAKDRAEKPAAIGLRG